jgi:methyl-accepting chemotaxis protein
MQIAPFLTNLLPGALLVVIIGAAGYTIGAHVQQREVDKLQEQLKTYELVGQQVAELTSTVEKSMKEHDQALVNAYTRELGKLRSDFGEAQAALAAATQDFKRQGRLVSTSAGDLSAAISRLPAGSAEREAKIAEVLAMMNDQEKRGQLCAVTPLAPAQLAPLKIAFTLDTP